MILRQLSVQWKSAAFRVFAVLEAWRNLKQDCLYVVSRVWLWIPSQTTWKVPRLPALFQIPSTDYRAPPSLGLPNSIYRRSHVAQNPPQLPSRISFHSFYYVPRIKIPSHVSVKGCILNAQNFHHPHTRLNFIPYISQTPYRSRTLHPTSTAYPKSRVSYIPNRDHLPTHWWPTPSRRWSVIGNLE